MPNGEVVRYGAGPALVFSFLLLGGACALAALCYAELAAMIPQAGSAYAYYLRDARRARRVDHRLGPRARVRGRQRRGRHLLGRLLHHADCAASASSLPVWLTTGYRTALLSSNPDVHGLLQSAPQIGGIPILVNLPAFGIVMVITWLLLRGAKESVACQQHHGGDQARGAGALRRRRRDAPRTPPTTRRSRPTDSPASTRARRSCSSRTSGSTPSPRPPRRHAIRSGTCRSGFSAGWPSAR